MRITSARANEPSGPITRSSTDSNWTVWFIPQSAALRLARAAERSNAAVIVMGDRSLCGTFAVLSLELRRRRFYFNRTASAAPATFDGQLIEARVTRNKLGGSGRAVVWQAAIDPLFTDPIVNITPLVEIGDRSRLDNSRVSR